VEARGRWGDEAVRSATEVWAPMRKKKKTGDEQWVKRKKITVMGLGP
jgi:hypothetical protein